MLTIPRFFLLFSLMLISLAMPLFVYATPIAKYKLERNIPIPLRIPSSHRADTQVQYCSPLGNTPIPDNNSTGITSVIEVPENAQILDLNVVLSVTHTYVGDLYISLTNTSTSQYLLNRPWGGSCSGDNLDNIISDDESLLWIEQSCTNDGPAYVPGESYFSGEDTNLDQLSIFDNLNTEGDWILYIEDQNINEVGILHQWCLQLTVSQPTSTNFVYAPLLFNRYQSMPCLREEIEPNNASVNAYLNLPLCQGSILNGVLPAGDSQDYYRIVVPNSSQVTVDLFNIAIGSDLDLYLYDEGLSQLAVSRNDGNGNEQITQTLTGGTYYVRIYADPTETGGGRTYQLRWSR